MITVQPIFSSPDVSVGRGGQVGVVGDDDGGCVAAESGDDELADGAGVAGQANFVCLVHARQRACR